MRTSRFTKSHILAVLKDGGAGMSVAELIAKHGISRVRCSPFLVHFGS